VIRYKCVVSGDLSPEDYRALAEFRFQLGRFLHFSEQAARREGLEPRQHQLLLAVRSLESPEGPTVGYLAERLLVRQHSAVGLIDRLEKKRLIRRVSGSQDRRQVRIRLTPAGERKLQRLSAAHRAELRTYGPALAAALDGLMGRDADEDPRSRAPAGNGGVLPTARPAAAARMPPSPRLRSVRRPEETR
jgi:DNA-binding MarR family transcriptional regulator